MGRLDYLNEKEVEHEFPFLKVKRLQAWRYLKSGGPAFLRIGRSIVYDRREIEHFLRSNLVDTGYEPDRAR